MWNFQNNPVQIGLKNIQRVITLALSQKSIKSKKLYDIIPYYKYQYL